MKGVLRIAVALVGLGYPLLVYLGLRHFEPRFLALVLGALLLLRLLLGPRRKQLAGLGSAMSLPLALLALAYSLTFLSNDGTFFLFVPTLFAAALFFSFARSLFRPPTIVESFARAMRTDLTDEHVAYCRRVTLVWCGFFLLNGTVSLALALGGNLEAWTLYNGLIAYILMGLLFAVEFAYRYRRFPPVSPAEPRSSAPSGPDRPVTRPEQLQRVTGDGWLELRLRVPEDLSYLEGHFDDFPVVAGVVQLQWISELASELLGTPAVIERMEQIKFHQLLQPGQAFSARLDHDRERSRIAYVLADGDTRFASGRLILRQ
jgi:uncharacterized membrane protein/3-hydroxymyristoyl/3-hydroxydecanoyl-(acyl carrier protein) dehydratase